MECFYFADEIIPIVFSQDMWNNESVLIVGDSTVKALRPLRSDNIRVEYRGGARLTDIKEMTRRYTTSSTTILVIMALHCDLTTISERSERAKRVLLPRRMAWDPFMVQLEGIHRDIKERNPQVSIVWTSPLIPDFLRYNCLKNPQAGRVITRQDMGQACRDFYKSVEMLNTRFSQQFPREGLLNLQKLVYGSAFSRGMDRCLSSGRLDRLRFPKGKTSDGLHPFISAGVFKNGVEAHVVWTRSQVRPSREPPIVPQFPVVPHTSNLSQLCRQLGEVTRQATLSYVGHELMQAMHVDQLARAPLVRTLLSKALSHVEAEAEAVEPQPMLVDGPAQIKPVVSKIQPVTQEIPPAVRRNSSADNEEPAIPAINSAEERALLGVEDQLNDASLDEVMDVSLL